MSSSVSVQTPTRFALSLAAENTAAGAGASLGERATLASVGSGLRAGSGGGGGGLFNGNGGRQSASKGPEAQNCGFLITGARALTPAKSVDLPLARTTSSQHLSLIHISEPTR